MRSIIVVVLIALCVLPAFATAERQEVEKPGGNVAAPQLVKEVKPAYPETALQAGLSGSVTLDCVVNADGSVGDVKVVKPLDPMLDAEAVKALKQWQFKPGTKDGAPVPVLVTVEMSFTYRPRGPRLDSPEVFRPGAEITEPRLVKDVKPFYTSDAMRSGVQGAVELECVVLPDGTVGDARVVQSLDAGLDAESLKALRQWRFEPGMKEGKAVPVRVTVTMTFTLKQ